MAESSKTPAPLARQAAMPEPTPELLEQAYAAIIDADVPPELDDPASIARAIAERIRRGTLAQSMEALEALPAWGDEFDGIALTVCSFKLNRSTFEIQEGPNKGRKGVYAIVELMDDQAKLHLVQTGATNVLTQLVKAWEEKRFPFRAAIEVKPTGQPGRTVQWLRTPADAA